MSRYFSFVWRMLRRDIRAGDSILKYGETIGRATEDIPAGRHAHIHNIESLRGRGDLA